MPAEITGQIDWACTREKVPVISVVLSTPNCTRPMRPGVFRGSILGSTWYDRCQSSPQHAVVAPNLVWAGRFGALPRPRVGKPARRLPPIRPQIPSHHAHPKIGQALQLSRSLVVACCSFIPPLPVSALFSRHHRSCRNRITVSVRKRNHYAENLVSSRHIAPSLGQFTESIARYLDFTSAAGRKRRADQISSMETCRTGR